MAWIRVESDLPDHPKSDELDALLGVTRSWTHVVQLWLWASRFRPKGNLDGLPDERIAKCAGWVGDATKFVHALRQVRFLDPDSGIHDWNDFQGKMLKRKAKDRIRKRVERRGNKGNKGDFETPDSAGRPQDIQGTSEGNPAPVHRKSVPTIRHGTTRDGTAPDETKNEEPLSTGVDLFGKTEKPKDRSRDAEIDRVLAHWKAVHGSERSLIDGKAGEKRRKRVKARLDEGTTADECILAIDGALRDPFLMGTDPKSPRAYRDVETILRDRAQVERLAALATGKPSAPRAEPVRVVPLAPPPPPKPKWTIETAVAAAHGFASFGPRKGRPRLVIPHGETIPEGFDTSPYEVIHGEPPRPRLQDLIPAGES